MKSFYEFISLLNEAPTPPSAPSKGANTPPTAPSATPSGGLESSLGGSLGSLGGPSGGLGALGGPSGGPSMNSGVMPDIRSPTSSSGAQSGPVKVQKVKTLDVWSVLEKISKNANIDSEQ